MRQFSVIGAVVGLLIAGVAGAAGVPPAAGLPPSAAPVAPPTVSIPLSDDVRRKLDESAARVRAADITSAMHASAVVRFNAADSTYHLNPGGAVVHSNTTVAEGTQETIRLVSDLLFDFGSAALTPVAATKLPEIVAAIPAGRAVAVNGYTDSIGTEAANLTLTQQRAQAVADVIAASRSDLQLTVTGFGEADPIAANTVGGEDNPAGRAQNRRVEIVYDA
ncbi:MAG: OmpA family protein [Propionibacteriaceae bacterium]|jgi:outer membrane protein OmpA-like peptidoglycan-associated protein|nr:OmpA family protein [Propionibacteriaceae bacterium]